MSENKNDTPYLSPDNKNHEKPQTRPLIPKVIGIITIAFGAYSLIMGILGIISTAFILNGMQQGEWSTIITFGYSKTYLISISTIATLMAVWAIFIGIKLIKYHDIGRQHFNYFIVVSILIFIAYYINTEIMISDKIKK